MVHWSEPEVARMRMGRRNRAGFSLIEVAVAVAVVGVLAALGIGLIYEVLPRYRTRHAALQFASWAAKARTLAVRNNVEYRIYLARYDDSLNTSPNVGAYMVQVGDKSQNSNYWDTLPKETTSYVGCPGSGAWLDNSYSEGTVDLSKGGNANIPDVSIAEWDTISGPSSSCQSNADAIVFSPLGWVTNPNADFGTSGYILVDFVNTEAYRKERSEVYRVSVARSGFARVDYLTASRYGDVSGLPMGVDGTSKENNSSASGSSGGD